MKKITNKIFAVVLAMMLTVSAISVVPAKAETATKKTAYVTIERFTIGQGFLLEPTKVEFTEGDTVEKVVDKAAKAAGIEPVYTESQFGAYLSGIKKADSGKINIPEEISDMGDFESFGVKYAAPTNENIRANDSVDGLLGEYTFTDMAGWFYYINNESASESASTLKVKDGDVIRLQFSIYGWGLDLGSLDWNTGEKKIQLVNKDALIRELAEVKAGTAITKSAPIKETAKAALNVAETYNPEESLVKAATEALKILNTVFEEGKAAQKQESEAQKEVAPSVAKATIKYVKNVKTCKAKIKVKTVKGATGYQFRYATNKKLKNPIVVSSKKVSVKTAKLTKKKTVYVKVRAYVKKNGAYYYGKWSAKKSVKIKK